MKYLYFPRVSSCFSFLSYNFEASIEAFTPSHLVSNVNTFVKDYVNIISLLSHRKEIKKHGTEKAAGAAAAAEAAAAAAAKCSQGHCGKSQSTLSGD